MMRSLAVSGLFAVLLAIGCGDSSGDADDGGDGGEGKSSCSHSATECTEIFALEAGTDGYKDACTREGATAGDACTITPKVGCCNFDGEGTSATCYYGSDYTEPSRLMATESMCTGLGGTWAPG